MSSVSPAIATAIVRRRARTGAIPGRADPLARESSPLGQPGLPTTAARKDCPVLPHCHRNMLAGFRRFASACSERGLHASERLASALGQLDLPTRDADEARAERVVPDGQPRTVASPRLERLRIRARRPSIQFSNSRVGASVCSVASTYHRELTAMPLLVLPYDRRVTVEEWALRTGVHGRRPTRTRSPASSPRMPSTARLHFASRTEARDEICAYWRRGAGTQKDVRVRMGRPFVDGERAAVEWWATMDDPDDGEVTLPGCLLLRFAPDGRCTELREYWHVRAGPPRAPRRLGDLGPLGLFEPCAGARAKTPPSCTSRLEGPMHLSRSLRRGVVLVALLALTAPLAAFADQGKGGRRRRKRGNGRVFYATDTGNSLLRFTPTIRAACAPSRSPGLPAGVSIRGSTSGRPRATCTRSAATRSCTGESGDGDRGARGKSFDRARRS